VHNITTTYTAADNKLRLVSLDIGTNRGREKNKTAMQTCRRSLLIQLILVSLDIGTNRGDGKKEDSNADYPPFTSDSISRPFRSTTQVRRSLPI